MNERTIELLRDAMEQLSNIGADGFAFAVTHERIESISWLVFNLLTVAVAAYAFRKAYRYLAPQVGTELKKMYYTAQGPVTKNATWGDVLEDNFGFVIAGIFTIVLVVFSLLGAVAQIPDIVVPEWAVAKDVIDAITPD